MRVIREISEPENINPKVSLMTNYSRLNTPICDQEPPYLEVDDVNWDRSTVIVGVNPLRCCTAAFIARDYTKLDQTSCAKLIESMSGDAGQTTPAVARLLSDDPHHSFEIISGARRLYAACWLRCNGHPDFKLQIKLVDMDSSTAFVAADVDNQKSSRVSPFERGSSMKHAAANFFESQQALATALGARPATVSTLIRLADWPFELLDAFPSPLSILKVDAERLSPALENPDRCELLLTEAKSLAMQQRARKETGSRLISRAVVAQDLYDASRLRKNKGSNDHRSLSHRVVSTPDGQEFLKFSISLPVTDKAALLARIEAELDLANTTS